jgi:predicted MFS family arabinose efflux permease
MALPAGNIRRGVEAVIAGSRLLGMLPARLVPLVPMITGGVTMIAGYAVLAAAQTTATVLLASALLGLTFSLFHSAFQTWATQLLPTARGTVTSLFVSCVFVGAAASSAWAGRLASRHAFSQLFAAASVLAGVVAATGIATRLRSRSPESKARRPAR